MICTFPTCTCVDGCAARLWEERAGIEAACHCCYCKDKVVRARRARLREVVLAGQAGMPYPPAQRYRMSVERIPLGEQASVAVDAFVRKLNTSSEGPKLPLILVPLKWFFDKLFPVSPAPKR